MPLLSLHLKSSGVSVVRLLVCSVVRLFVCSFVLGAERPQVVTISSPSPLIQISIMVRSGSIHDPAGKEGLAYLTAQSLLEGGFGNPKDPVTKEELALITRPWGEGAMPAVRVAKEVTTFYITVPQDVLDEYLQKVLQPLFTQPLFQGEELDRLRNEVLEQVSGSLRYEDIENLGLNGIDHYIFQGTRYAHLPEGSVQGLKGVTRGDLLAFYGTYYRPESLIVGLSKEDAPLKTKVTGALSGMGSGIKAGRLRRSTAQKVERIQGRRLVIISLPNADSTGIHAAFPISVTRKDSDYWPLYVANVYFGLHRDSFSHLFREIRQERGYNYGDYSYIEHFENRPRFLFPPFNTPRNEQYFSIWVRPVAHNYTHHLLKAITWELEDFVRKGLTAEQVELTKNKAKVLYLNLGETVSRLLNARLDDVFYGTLRDGHLDNYLKSVDAVTVEQVNAAIRKHLQADNIKYVVVTDDEVANQLASEVAAGGLALGKTLEEYRIPTIEHQGRQVLAVAPDKLQILQKDAIWSSYPLDIQRSNIRIVPVEQIFETGEFIATKATEAPRR